MRRPVCRVELASGVRWLNWYASGRTATILPASWRRRSSRSATGQGDEKEGRQEEVLPGLSAAERDELARLRRENRQLPVERGIMSKAAACFARETEAMPSGFSGT